MAQAPRNPSRVAHALSIGPRSALLPFTLEEMPLTPRILLAARVLGTVVAVAGRPDLRTEVAIGADGIMRGQEALPYIGDGVSFLQGAGISVIEVGATGESTWAGATGQVYDEAFEDDESLLQTQMLSTAGAVADLEEEAYAIDTSPVYLLQDSFRLVPQDP
uniref:Uncharacterized protein n=1 Tax=Alexandrium catenella TaxID=2925 RepID=A0A7S1RJE3_ALECA